MTNNVFDRKALMTNIATAIKIFINGKSIINICNLPNTNIILIELLALCENFYK